MVELEVGLEDVPVKELGIVLPVFVRQEIVHFVVDQVVVLLVTVLSVVV